MRQAFPPKSLSRMHCSKPWRLHWRLERAKDLACMQAGGLQMQSPLISQDSRTSWPGVFRCTVVPC